MALNYRKVNRSHIVTAQAGEYSVELIRCREPKESLSQVYARLDRKPDVLINAGFFDMATGRSVSGMVLGGKVAHDRDMGGAVLYWRKGHEDLQINPLGATTEMSNFAGWTQWALETGPLLVPYSNGGRGKVPTSITDGKAPRTAVGLTADGGLIVAVTDQRPYGVTCRAMGAELQRLGAVKAINLDGGGSSEMLVAGKRVVGTGRAVGSVLAVYLRERPQPAPRPSASLRVVIDAGHGLHTAGKRTPDGSLREHEFNSAVARLVADALAGYDGVAVKLAHDPTGAVDVALAQRVAVANDWDADCYVSIHANAYGAGGWHDAQGIETFVHTSRPAEALALAGELQSRLVAATGRPDRGVKASDFYVLRKTAMTAVLAECGFMTNRAEAVLLKSATYRQQCAQAIVDALVAHYGLVRKHEQAVYRVQVGAFSERGRAEAMAEELRKAGYPAIIKREGDE